jgi:hypothetical protein
LQTQTGIVALARARFRRMPASQASSSWHQGHDMLAPGL